MRQNIQLHWVTIESLPEVLEELWRVGLNTTGSCGDVTRNITGCQQYDAPGEIYLQCGEPLRQDDDSYVTEIQVPTAKI